MYYSIRIRTIAYEWGMKLISTKMREAEILEIIIVLKELTVQWEKGMPITIFNITGGCPGGSKPGSFPLAWPNFLFLHYFYWACSFRLLLLLYFS